MDDNINQAFVIGTFRNAYLTEAERLASGQYKFTFALHDGDEFEHNGIKYNRIRAIGNTDGRHLISISVLNDGMDTVDGEYLYLRSETPPVKGRQRQMGIASWLREHGYNAANGMPRLCFSLPMPDFA